MEKDQAIGAVLTVGCVVGIIVYAWLLFLTGYGVIVLSVTAFIGVAVILGILAWIGWTMATTPPPAPLEPEPLPEIPSAPASAEPEKKE